MLKTNLLLLVFFSVFSFAQNSGKVVYKATIFDLHLNSETDEVLEFNQGKVLYYEIPNSKDKKASAKDLSFKVKEDFIYTENGQVYNYLNIEKKDIVGVEPLCNIHWEITNEEKKINDFTCYKAMGKFRGREYVVWFTPEIPVPYGPWKLGGLPGLILEAEETNTNLENRFVYIVSEINIPYENTENIPLAKNHIASQKHLSYKEAVDKKYKLYNEIGARIKASMPKGTNIINEKGHEKFAQEQNLDCE
ncbi:MAG: GLPGLI family protein [Cruoricaptor ignavus]|nr:GLPGLI family protein [Cruoricaptor ignavus]